MPTIFRAKTIGAMAVVSAVAVAASFPFWGSKNEDKTIGTVTKKDLIQKVTVAGTIYPNRKTVISPPYNAYIQKIFVKVGDTVKAGQPVVSLVQSLRNLAEPVYPMRAPFDGTVVQIPRGEGEFVEAKQENGIIRVDDISRLFAVCEVPETSVANMKKGQEVVIKPNSGATRDYKGVIREVFLAAKDTRNQGGWGRPGDRVNFEVRMEVLDIDASIRPGMSAIVDIITGKRDQVLTLRHEFIEKNVEGYFVTLASGGKKKIEVGLSNEEDFEVTSGVTENMKVKLVDFASLPQL